MQSEKVERFKDKGQDLVSMALALSEALEKTDDRAKPLTNQACYESIVALSSIIKSLSLLFKDSAND